jgi:hypothetical protein
MESSVLVKDLVNLLTTKKFIAITDSDSDELLYKGYVHDFLESPLYPTVGLREVFSIDILDGGYYITL